VVTLATSLGQLEPRLESRLTDPEISQVCALAAKTRHWSGVDTLALPRLQEMTFKSFHAHRTEISLEQRQSLEGVYRVAKSFAERPEGWLVLMGENGVGKTHLAAAIAHACRERGIEVRFLDVPDLLEHLRRTFRPDSNVSYDDLFEEVKQVPLLVLDDLGAQTTSPWAREKLYQIINYRYNARLPLVVTTNLGLQELEKAEPRIASRLADARFSVPFLIAAPSFTVDRPGQQNRPSWASERTSRASTPMDRRRPGG
jgi:DNA replication protein DnaC